MRREESARWPDKRKAKEGGWEGPRRRKGGAEGWENKREEVE